MSRGVTRQPKTAKAAAKPSHAQAAAKGRGFPTRSQTRQHRLANQLANRRANRLGRSSHLQRRPLQLAGAGGLGGGGLQLHPQQPHPQQLHSLSKALLLYHQNHPKL